MELELTVKLALYRQIAEMGFVPDSQQLATVTGLSKFDVEIAFAELEAKRLLVPEPGDPSRIRMAPPFSGVETNFHVLIGDKRYFANCIWDAFGIAAALRKDATIQTTDAHTDEAITMHVSTHGSQEKNLVGHFAVPAAKWWADIIYT